MTNSQTSLSTKDAYIQGYRATKNGSIVSPTGRTLILHKHKVGNAVYLSFKMRYNGKPLNVYVHKFVAYQKFGDISFSCDCIRHLDGNSENNSFDNIEMGTNSENSFDRPKEQRISQAKNASKHMMVYSDKEVLDIKEYHAKTKSYKKTMAHFGISSKASLHFILNKR